MSSFNEKLSEMSVEELVASLAAIQSPAIAPAQTPAVTIKATRFKWIDPKELPRDQWLYGYFLQRGFVALTIATGGTGKSIVSITEALAMISGRTLLHDVAHSKLRVWLVNLEDPQMLLQKRVTAAALHYDVAREVLEERLFLDSGRDQEVKIATASRDGAVIVEPVYDAIVATIRENKIDVLIVDPFVSCHSVSENDNNAIDTVVKRWGKIAHVTNCAVHLIHHSRKPGGEAVSTEHSRGASALNDGARASRTMNVMTKDEACKAGVKNRSAYVRIDDGKQNLAPPSERTSWIRKDSINLANGDSAPVVTTWEWPDAMADVTRDDLAVAQDALGDGEWRADSQSAKWAGKPIAAALRLDIGDKATKAKVRMMIAAWEKSGALLTKSGKDEHSKDRVFIIVGKRAIKSGGEMPPLPPLPPIPSP
jgi:KaiC/GvpD/RAD55 family RecA-like ATPase